MSVDDNYREVIRKSAEQVTPGNPNEYRLRTTGTFSGTVTPSGLTIGGRVTTLDVSTTAIALPSTPLADRNAIAIHNLSATDTLYIGFNTSITADTVLGTTAGWEIEPLSKFNLDVTDSIVIYAISTGTVRVKVFEVA